MAAAGFVLFVTFIYKIVVMSQLQIYLCGGQAVADSEAIDRDLDLALIDHVDDCFSCSVHGDHRHRQCSVRVSIWFLVVVALHLDNQVKFGFISVNVFL